MLCSLFGTEVATFTTMPVPLPQSSPSQHQLNKWNPRLGAGAGMENSQDRLGRQGYNYDILIWCKYGDFTYQVQIFRRLYFICYFRNGVCELFFQVLMFRCFRLAPCFSGFQDQFCSVFMLSPLPLVPWCVLNYPLHRCHLRVIIFLLVLSCYVGGIALP